MEVVVLLSLFSEINPIIRFLSTRNDGKHIAAIAVFANQDDAQFCH